MSTDSPSPAKDLGRIAKVLGLLEISYEELQVIIDHPSARRNAKKALGWAVRPPMVRLLRMINQTLGGIPTLDYREAELVDIDQILGSLDTQERRVIELRYGFDGPALTLQALGKMLSITPERVRQIENQALDKLRSAGPYAAGFLVKELGISPRSLHILEREGFVTLSELVQRSRSDLNEITGMCPSDVIQIENALVELGFCLRKD